MKSDTSWKGLCSRPGVPGFQEGTFMDMFSLRRMYPAVLCYFSGSLCRIGRMYRERITGDSDSRLHLSIGIHAYLYFLHVVTVRRYLLMPFFRESLHFALFCLRKIMAVKAKRNTKHSTSEAVQRRHQTVYHSQLPKVYTNDKIHTYTLYNTDIICTLNERRDQYKLMTA